ncbi:MAG TPA: 1-acyl-sn-glycerol-3-phosphate acyltransferase [Candidatus Polarisedimenticolia bacterium]|nr:1-acyl-sn-glycerol-3-phosphate acyltransferase [Candidatus Polarisedimenticolia bacterium]
MTGADPGPLPEDETIWRGRRETGLVGPPSPRASWAYRVAMLAFRVLIRGVFGIRITVEGATNLPRTSSGAPAGGWIAAGLPHRTWIDPFAVALVLPMEPRLVFFGDGRAMFRTAWRRFWVRQIGGIIPIWVRRYVPGVEREDVMATYTAAVSSALSAGTILAIFPETGPPVPVDQARPFGRGLAYFALRTGAPIVPLIIGGSDVLFRGRRIVVRVLPPVDARTLAGLDATVPAPEAGSRDERLASRRATDALQALTAPHVPEVRALAEPPPGTPRRWLWLTHVWR